MTLSVTQKYTAWIDGMTVNNKLKRCERNLSWLNLKILSWIFARRGCVNHEKPVEIVGVPDEIQTEHLWNTSQNWYCLSQLAE